MNKKDKEGQVPVWQQKGFFSRQHYAGFLWFNGLVYEEVTYDSVYKNQFTGETVNLEDY